MAKPIRIIGDPDNQRPDKWTSNVLTFLTGPNIEQSSCCLHATGLRVHTQPESSTLTAQSCRDVIIITPLSPYLRALPPQLSRTSWVHKQRQQVPWFAYDPAVVMGSLVVRGGILTH